eukprot:CAMPEP_0196703510 /NCGR_PEP_ID=MMETSP1090-20130531/55964_1 /TAXON_ID=37098 /ORGANISM="Isochrysis sp, Strain CCMP1244" /LENGTH=100 /DNA_ID=CAMNT_0042043367 /DNA_START=32 /DNA_END=332 /DNA_ORIENTATION=-
MTRSLAPLSSSSSQRELQASGFRRASRAVAHMRPSGVPAAIQPRSGSLPRASRPERPAQRADRALVGGAAAADDRLEPRRADAARPLPRQRVGKAALAAD